MPKKLNVLSDTTLLILSFFIFNIDFYFVKYGIGAVGLYDFLVKRKLV